VNLAARGTRETDGGEAPVPDPAEARLLREQARRIHVEAVVTGALLTGLSVLAGGWLAA